MPAATSASSPSCPSSAWAELEAATAGAPQEREAQKALAAEVTRLVHGEDALVRSLHNHGGAL